MATYYVRPDGNNSNTGLGSGTGTAWQTLAKALGASGIGSGDTLYIAPGTYTESVTIGGTYTAPTYVYGDPLCQQFTGISAGSVWHSSATSTGNDQIINAILVSGSGKSNLNFRNIHWLSCNNYVQVSLLLGQNNTFAKCVFEQVYQAGPANCVLTAPSTLALNVVFDSCIFLSSSNNTGACSLTGNNVADTSTVKNCLFIGTNTYHGVLLLGTQCEVINCNFNNYNIAVGVGTGSATFVSSVKNCVFSRCANAVLAVTLGHVTATYNRLCVAALSNVATSITNQTQGISGFDTGYSLLAGLQNLQFFSSYLGSPNTSAGIATGAPVTDMYGVTWTGTSPDTGSATYRSLSAVGQYNPTDRNASTITIAPGSTSQSIELYLGVTGLTASTSGLSAYYNRTRTASVSITLVARTIAQAWTSGGFVEVDPVGMPGVYRLDIPNEALLGGADDCTVVVRGASGTNGAVMTIDLRNYTFVTTTGYKLISDQMGANGILDVIKGSSITVKLQMVDVNNKPIPIGTAACTVEVYSINNLVETYPTVIQYQSNGELTFVLDTQVTSTPGTYNIYVVRNNGGSDTVLYGPMKLVVSNL